MKNHKFKVTEFESGNAIKWECDSFMIELYYLENYGGYCYGATDKIINTDLSKPDKFFKTYGDAVRWCNQFDY